MSAYEEILERQYEDAYAMLHRAKTPEGQQAAWEQMCKARERITAERFLKGWRVA
jgi:hypothetical protein